MTSKKEFSEAGKLLGDMLATSLFPGLAGNGSWDGCRQPYVWEHNALCWLVRNRASIKSLNLWTHTLLEKGYPFTDFIDLRGVPRPAGYYWNATMEPKRD